MTFTVHSGSGVFAPVEGYRDEPLGTEGIDWLRGHHADDSRKVQAARAALALQTQPVWTTAKRGDIRVGDMDNDHLCHTIALFRHMDMSPKRAEQFKHVIAEAARRGLEIPT